MGRQRKPLPTAVADGAVRSADAVLWGITESRRRRDDSTRPFHGMSAFGARTNGTHDACLMYEAVRLPGQFYSHTTAAELWGAPLPSSQTGPPLHVAVEAPRSAPRRPGVIGHSLRVESLLPLRTADGLPVAAPPEMWCQLATILTREDLLAVGDFLVSGKRTDRGREPALCSLRELRDAACRNRGSRGSSAMAWALPLIRTGVDSRPESHLRLVLVEAGLPEPLVAPPINVGAERILHPDLAYMEERVAIEYEGDGHRVDRARWRRDIERREAFEAAGWRVIRVTADDLYVAPTRLLARIRRILATRST
ncbi:endonuclease domain-containing protein [Microbacterium sp. P06]|uniref:endonuclease domain-containing protein n=1 Tax=Microbacterium sp. P06 TaxID=3366949 RepID=UPI003746BABE